MSDLDKCPFCGAARRENRRPDDRFECGSYFPAGGFGVITRVQLCYALENEHLKARLAAKDAECAELKALIEELEGALDNLQCVLGGADGYWCPNCAEPCTATHDEKCSECGCPVQAADICEAVEDARKVLDASQAAKKGK